MQKLISNKKNVFFENRLNDSIGKPKGLRKILKYLGWYWLMTDMILVELQKAYTIENIETYWFWNHIFNWFKSYFSNQILHIPQGSILGPLLFLIYVNDMSQAVKSNLFLYADDSCLVFQGKDVIEIEKQLNGDFKNICKTKD